MCKQSYLEQENSRTVEQESFSSQFFFLFEKIPILGIKEL